MAQRSRPSRRVRSRLVTRPSFAGVHRDDSINYRRYLLLSDQACQDQVPLPVTWAFFFISILTRGRMFRGLSLAFLPSFSSVRRSDYLVRHVSALVLPKPDYGNATQLGLPAV